MQNLFGKAPNTICFMNTSHQPPASWPHPFLYTCLETGRDAQIYIYLNKIKKLYKAWSHRGAKKKCKKWKCINLYPVWKPPARVLIKPRRSHREEFFHQKTRPVCRAETPPSTHTQTHCKCEALSASRRKTDGSGSKASCATAWTCPRFMVSLSDGFTAISRRLRYKKEKKCAWGVMVLLWLSENFGQDALDRHHSSGLPHNRPLSARRPHRKLIVNKDEKVGDFTAAFCWEMLMGIFQQSHGLRRGINPQLQPSFFYLLPSRMKWFLLSWGQKQARDLQVGHQSSQYCPCWRCKQKHADHI